MSDLYHEQNLVEDQQPLIMPTPLSSLWRTDANLREPVIDGLLRRGQVGNIVATSKSYKTYLILGLAISMALQRMWLDRFPCIGGRVLIIDLELQKPDITKRTIDIAKAMYASMDELGAAIDVISFRGRNGDINQIERLLLSLEPRTYELVIVDPLYKCYPDQFDENSNAQMTNLYRRWERLAEHLDGAMVIVHHGSKGSQSEKRVVDVGSGASAQSRSADCHIALREHEVDGCVSFDARVRSFAPVDPMVLRWEYPLWHRDPLLDPAMLKTTGRRRGGGEEKSAPKATAEPWTVKRFVETFISDTAKTKESIIARATFKDISGREAAQLLTLAEEDRLIFRHPAPTKNDRKHYYANRQPTVFDAQEPARNDSLTRALPPTPPNGERTRLGAGVARVGAKQSAEADERVGAS